MDDKLLIEADEGMPNLLQTIRVPKNIHYLTERLPKPNYSPLKLKKLDKVKFI
jgi:NIMA (never in mitosis gene a)-related kinase